MSTPVRIGRYLVTGTLGCGGMGVVYRGIDLERDVDVAIKTLPTLDARGLLRLKREFRVMADITHHHLAALYELQTDGDEWFFTMELIDGVHFIDYVLGPRPAPVLSAESSSTIVDGPRERPTRQMARSGLTRRTWPSEGDPAGDPAGPSTSEAAEPSPLHREAERRLRQALRQLVLGVAALHAAGKVHRDLKPSNVMVERSSARVVVLDFGLVEDRERLDGTMIAGTPEYAAPEQLDGQASPASDWYAVGIMLYESLTGQRPFRGNTRELTAAKQLGEPVRADRLMAGIPEDLAELCSALLRRDPSSRPDEARILAALGLTGETHATSPRTSAPVVGRERELGELWERYRTVRAGEAQIVFIHGRSGMGKSTILGTFIDQLRRHEDALVLGGRCYEREALPYKALDSAVDALASTLRTWSEAELSGLEIRPELRQAFPVLSSILPDESVAADAAVFAGADLVEQRRQAFAGLRRLLGAIAAKRPVVVWIDDLQWGDGDSARLLSELWARPSSPRVLWVCTYRDEAVRESELLRLLLSPTSLGSDERAHFIEVGPLSLESCERLARSIAEHSPNVAVTVERIHEIAGEAAGSPYLVEELARHLTSDARGAAREASVESLLRLRLDELPPQARRLLETVAVAGRPLSQRIAFGAAGLEGTPYATLGLLRSAFLLRTQGMGDNDPLETYHDRVRECVVASLTPDERAATHRRLARALRASASPDAHELARHLFEGGEHSEARRFAELAGDHAARALAFDQASSLYAMAIESLEAADPRVRAVLEEKRADALVRIGRAGDAAPLFLSAAQSAPPQRARDLRRRAAEQLLVSGRFDEGTAALRPVLASVGVTYPESPGRALAEVLYRFASLELRGTRFNERREPLLSFDELAPTDVCWSAVKGLLSVDSIRAALFIVRSLQEALRIGEPMRIARALTIFGMVQVYEGAPRGVLRGNRLLDQAGEIAAALSDPYLDGIGDTCRGTAEMSVGHWREGLTLMERGIERLRTRCTGVTWEINATVSSTFNTRLWLGDMAGIRRRADAWGREAEGLGDLFATVTAELYTALAELAAGNPERTRRLVNLAMSRWTHSVFTYQTWLALKLRVLCDLYDGRPNMAHDRLLASWKQLERSHLLRVQLMLIDAHLLRATTGLAKASARGDASALRGVEADVRALERVERPTARGAAALVRGGLCRLRGDAVGERGELRAAIAHFDAIGVELHAACARARLSENLGDAAGAGEKRAAFHAMKQCGVDDPRRWLGLYAPVDAPLRRDGRQLPR